jgi:GNAT superfamily N-acetyltransferase
MDVPIRPRADADLPGCVAALRAVHETDRYPLNWPDDPTRWLTPRGLAAAWVATLDDVPLAGHALLLDAGADLELARLFVPPAARRRAVASALLTEAARFAATAGRALVLEVCDEERSPAIAVYEATGWRFTHSSLAGWTAPDGSPVRLRHYRRPGAG